MSKLRSRSESHSMGGQNSVAGSQEKAIVGSMSVWAKVHNRDVDRHTKHNHWF